MQVPGEAPGRFRVGQPVRIKHGFRGLIGQVVEDRGPIGIGGQRLYAIRLRLDPWNERTTELPEEALEAVRDGSTSTPQPRGQEERD
jgi:hypothetical protein